MGCDYKKEEIKTMEKNTIDYGDIRLSLMLLAEQLGLSERLRDQILLIESLETFNDVFRRNLENILVEFDITSGDDDEIEELKWDVSRKEDHIEDLEFQLEEFRSRPDITVSNLDEEYKINAFIENWNDYTSTEVELLFMHGKEFLKSIPK